MHFLKEDLVGTHYHWSGHNDKQLFLGQPARRLFDPHNGNQVLFLINYFAANSTEFTKLKGKLIEDKIMNQLPLDAKSEISVFNWIVAKLAEMPQGNPTPINL